MQSKISVVINTLNEEKNLPNALRSVHSWADEIIVVDMHSEDRTVEIAKEYGAKVFYHDRILEFDDARRFAIEQASNSWILLLDADELVPMQLSLKLREIADNDVADVVIIPWLNYLLGTQLMHTGWGPHQDKHERFFKKGMIAANANIHAFLTTSDGARVLALPYEPGQCVVHFNFMNIEQHIEKINRYTTIEAYQKFKRGTRASYSKMFYWAMREFVSRFIIHKGYCDGWRGFYLSLNLAFYRIAIFAKLTELEMVGDRAKVKDIYTSEAEAFLEEYDGIR